MRVVHFFIGSGGWICWYLSFWGIILVCVVMVLEVFRRELKPRGEKPATASLGSCMVVAIAGGLGFVTLANGLFFTNAIDSGWWTKLVAILAAIAVTGVMIPVNCRLAELQSHPSYWANVILAAMVIGANLYLLHLARTTPHFSMPLSQAWPALVAVLFPCAGALCVIHALPPRPPAPPPDPNWYKTGQADEN